MTVITNIFPCPKFTASSASLLTMTNIDVWASQFSLGSGSVKLKAAGTTPVPCARCENINVSAYQGKQMVMSAKTYADDADVTSIGPAPFYVEFDTGDTRAPDFKNYGKDIYRSFDIAPRMGSVS